MRSSPELSKNRTIQAIPLDQLEKNEWNCSMMTKEEHESLRKSMKVEGQLSPVIVTPRDRRFLVIDGEKRLASAVELAWKSLLAIVEERVTDDEVKIRSFASHYNRGSLDPIKTFNLFYEDWAKMENSCASGRFDGDLGSRGKKKGITAITTRQLEQKYGLDQSWICRILTIRQIPKPIRNYIGSLMPRASKRFSIKHALVLAEKANIIPQSELKKVVDYFFSAENNNVESYTDLKLLLETAVEEFRNSAKAIQPDDLRQITDHIGGVGLPTRTGKELIAFCSTRGSGSALRSRILAEGNFDCVKCGSHYMVDWKNRRVLELIPQDAFVKASEVQTPLTRITDKCPQCNKQIAIDFDRRTIKWI